MNESDHDFVSEATTREDLFCRVRQLIVKSLQEDGFFPDDDDFTPEHGEAVLFYLASAFKETHQDLLVEAARLIAKLRINLLGETSGLGRASVNLLGCKDSASIGGTVQTFQLGVEVSRFVRRVRTKKSDSDYEKGLSYYISFGALTGGDEPNARQVFDHLGRRESDWVEFPKTFRRWRAKWRAYDVGDSFKSLPSSEDI